MIKIIADSTCDLTGEELKAWDISTLPLTIHFGDKSYKDGIDISKREFYEKLAGAKTLPTTSQVPPGDFEHAFRKQLGADDELLVVTIASALSATYQSAVTAAKAVDANRIHVVDSMTGSFGHALLLRHAVKLRNEGKLSAAQLAKELQELAPRVRLYAVVDTLKYLKMGGRLSGSAAFIGSLLGIKPLIEVKLGKVHSIAKVRGEKNVIKTLYDYFQLAKPDLSYGISFGNSQAKALMEETIRYFSSHLGAIDFMSVDLGAVIGTHVGPGVTGIGFIVKE
jgi:DegV family protein with EDD domain